MKKILVSIFILLSISANARIRYVSTRGNDLNTGADSSATGAWKTWRKGFSEAMPGDTIYFMGGVYYSTGKIIVNPVSWPGLENGIGHSGTAEKPIMYSSYPGQWAILDCSQHCANKPYDPIGNPYYNSALEFYCVGWIHLKDFEVRNVWQCDNVLTGAITSFLSVYMTFEHLVLHDISNRAFEVEGGAFKSFEPYMDWTSIRSYWNFDVDTTRFINCDIYNVCDTAPGEIGNGGDVFHTSLYPENVMIWEGCRLWNYADDGFNAAGAGGLRIINNCWMMPTRKYYWTDGVFETERNGMKAGWNAHPFTDEPWLWPIPEDHNTLEVSNCLVMFAEQAFREGPQNIGYYHNNTIYRCNMGFENTHDPTPTHSFMPSYKNNLIHRMDKYNAYGLPYYTWIYNAGNYDESNNTWVHTLTEPFFAVNTPLVPTDDDFVGLTGNLRQDSLYLTSLFIAPRKSDGSLPDIKPLMLKEGSKLINAGTPNISIGTQNVNKILNPSEYYGSAPDIGYAEYKSETTTPSIPEFHYAVIENSAPAKLEITYSLTLANIIPATSAFAVRVNSTARAVSSVTVSGTKVILTLVSPVTYGDVVTMAYTKPATNPLQTAAGGQAASLAAQNVTNNVGAPIPVYVSSVIENSAPAKLEITYSLTLANIIPATSAFTVRVNSTARAVSSVAVSGTKATLTLVSPVAYGDVVTMAYTKPATNPLQTAAGGQAASLAAQVVINNCSLVINLPPTVNISSPTKNTTFTAPASITIDAVASDSDGSVIMIEFFNGNIKIGECLSMPYYFVWKEVPAGEYILTAVATDNLNSKTTSDPVSIIVENSASVVNQKPSINILKPSPHKGKKFKKNEKIIIEVEASDPDGEITKVEFKNGDITIAELFAAPYIYVMENADTGKYSITAIAFDNLGAASEPTEVEFIVFYSSELDRIPIKVYPNPNHGTFTVDLPLLESEMIPDRISIVDMSGKMIAHYQLSGQQESMEFNLTDAFRGTYIIMLIRDHHIISTGKFIIK